MRILFYPGSFDPVTFGHLDVILRARRLADQLIIGVGKHHEKRARFSVEERIDMLQEVLADQADAGGWIKIISFDNLAVEAARQHGATALLRGLRDTADFTYEVQMAAMNADIGGEAREPIETIFLAARPQYRHIAAKFVRQIAAMGGDVSAFVPDAVAARLAK